MLTSMVLKVEFQLWAEDIIVYHLRDMYWQVICKRYLCIFGVTVIQEVRRTKRWLLRILFLEFFLFTHVFQHFFGDFNYFKVNFWLYFSAALLLTLPRSDHD